MPTKPTSREVVNAWIYPLYQRLRSRSHLIVFLKRRCLGLWLRMGLTKGEFPDTLLKSEADAPWWAITERILAEVATEAEKHGLPTLYVLIPPDFQVNEEWGMNFAHGAGYEPAQVDLDQATRILEERLTQRGLSVFNAVAALRKSQEGGVQIFGRVDRHSAACAAPLAWTSPNRSGYTPANTASTAAAETPDAVTGRRS